MQLELNAAVGGAFGGGGADTVTLRVRELEAPSSSVTVSLTL